MNQVGIWAKSSSEQPEVCMLSKQCQHTTWSRFAKRRLPNFLPFTSKLVKSQWYFYVLLKVYLGCHRSLTKKGFHPASPPGEKPKALRVWTHVELQEADLNFKIQYKLSPACTELHWALSSITRAQNITWRSTQRINGIFGWVCFPKSASL